MKIPCFYSETGRFEILKTTSASVVKATVDCRANACAFPQGIHPICRWSWDFCTSKWHSNGMFDDYGNPIVDDYSYIIVIWWLWPESNWCWFVYFHGNSDSIDHLLPLPCPRPFSSTRHFADLALAFSQLADVQGKMARKSCYAWCSFWGANARWTSETSKLDLSLRNPIVSTALKRK